MHPINFAHGREIDIRARRDVTETSRERSRVHCEADDEIKSE
jgi:hypothetical protein